MTDQFQIVIPAIKKSGVIPDQLIRTLNGKILIQHAVDLALGLVSKQDVLILTDSVEIRLLAVKQGLRVYYNKKYFDDFLDSRNFGLDEDELKLNSRRNTLILFPDAPLLTKGDIEDAIQRYLAGGRVPVCSVRAVRGRRPNKPPEASMDSVLLEIDVFYLFGPGIKLSELDTVNFNPHELSADHSVKITGYQDWWVCEKLLNRKVIVFNVIGTEDIGAGHIYRALGLAHEIHDHEVLFLCGSENSLAVKRIAATDYKVLEVKDVLSSIRRINPDLVINDCLDTDAAYISQLHELGCRVVNFEDLGSGAPLADLTINELYEKPLLASPNIRWGWRYVTLRDEFNDVEPGEWRPTVKNILITFGGTDPNNIAFEMLTRLSSPLQALNIQLNVICGPGYTAEDSLEPFDCFPNVKIHYSVASMTEHMQQCDLAISSNGRTIYELCQMNIPTIVICHHEREMGHDFVDECQGLLKLGLFSDAISDACAEKVFELIRDHQQRKRMATSLKSYCFNPNKERVVSEILGIL